MFWLRTPQFAPSFVPSVMHMIDEQTGTGVLLINGSFGHEWQQASSTPVQRYTLAHLDRARAVICLKLCPDMKQQTGWVSITGLPIEAWVKKP
jgi:hypothetical protein